MCPISCNTFIALLIKEQKGMVLYGKVTSRVRGGSLHVISLRKFQVSVVNFFYHVYKVFTVILITQKHLLTR